MAVDMHAIRKFHKMLVESRGGKLIEPVPHDEVINVGATWDDYVRQAHEQDWADFEATKQRLADERATRPVRPEDV